MPWVQNISCNHYFRERDWNFLRENSRLLLPKLLILNTLKWNLSNGGKQSNVLLCKAEYVVKSLCTRCAVYHDFLQCWTRMRYVIFQLLHSYLRLLPTFRGRKNRFYFYLIQLNLNIQPNVSKKKIPESGKFWYLKYFFPWRPFTQHALHIFSYSNFRCRYLDNQSEYRKSLITVSWLMPCE